MKKQHTQEWCFRDTQTQQILDKRLEASGPLLFSNFVRHRFGCVDARAKCFVTIMISKPHKAKSNKIVDGGIELLKKDVQKYTKG
eukprot:3735452-Amphidinium_carterae.2